MKAVRISNFGSLDVMEYTDVPRPESGNGQLRVRVKAAGVGPWGALIREGKSGVAQTLPLILGSDIAGIVDAIGRNVSDFNVGDEVYGVTNERFTGGYAEYALASAGMMAQKPRTISFIEAASAHVVAVTAWQMLFEYAHATAGQKVLIQGGAGNVGAYAVQLAKDARATRRDRDSFLEGSGIRPSHGSRHGYRFSTGPIRRRRHFSGCSSRYGGRGDPRALPRSIEARRDSRLGCIVTDAQCGAAEGRQGSFFYSRSKHGPVEHNREVIRKRKVAPSGRHRVGA